MKKFKITHSNQHGFRDVQFQSHSAADKTTKVTIHFTQGHLMEVQTIPRGEERRTTQQQHLGGVTVRQRPLQLSKDVVRGLSQVEHYSKVLVLKIAEVFQALNYDNFLSHPLPLLQPLQIYSLLQPALCLKKVKCISGILKAENLCWLCVSKR